MTQEDLIIKQYKDYYSSLSTLDLISTVTNENVLSLSENLSIPRFELQRYFAATNELLSRMELMHSCHNDEGEHILTDSNYDITDFKAGVKTLQNMNLSDGDVIAKITIGNYKAARRTPEIIF